MTSDNSSRVGGAVITYHPDALFEQRLARIREQLDDVIVFDNSTQAHARETVARTAQRLCCVLLQADSNLGIGAALNAAFAAFARAGKRWVVAFDQDSTPEPGLVNALLQLGECGNTGVVGSNWRDECRPDHRSRFLTHGTGLKPWFRRKTADSDIRDVEVVITSGSAFSIQAWEAVGGFREDLFLDLVDTEYCLRVHRAGWSVGVAVEARLHHRRGSKTPVQRLGRTWWPSNMPPFRVRLLIRNRVWVMLRYGWTRWPWALHELTHTAFILFSILFLEHSRHQKALALIRGVGDGLMGRLGRPAPEESSHPGRPSASGF